MKHLVFVGPGNTGKTTMVNRTTHELLQQGFEFVPREDSWWNYRLPNLELNDDFFALLRKGDILVLVYTWSDVPKWINRLKHFLETLSIEGISPNLIIMGSRDASEWLYNYTRNTLNLTADNTVEIPLGRMVRGTRREAGVRWYIPAVENMVNRFVLPQILDEL